MSCYEFEGGSYRLNKAGVKLFKDMFFEMNRAELTEGLQFTNEVIKSINKSPIQFKRALQEHSMLTSSVYRLVEAGVMAAISKKMNKNNMANYLNPINDFFTEIGKQIKDKKILNNQSYYDNDKKISEIMNKKISTNHELSDLVDKACYMDLESRLVNKFIDNLNQGIDSKPIKLNLITAKEMAPYKFSRTKKDFSGMYSRLNVDNQMLYWHVEENNHAVRDARESFEGKMFFSTLNKVEWGRGTGGYINYMSEYTREHSNEPEKVNFKGPVGKKEQEHMFSRFK